MKFMGRPRKTIEVPQTALEAQVTPASMPPINVPTSPPIVVNVEPGKRYDYKMLYATGAATMGLKWEHAFDQLGKDGYLFVGESAGRSVFVKAIG